MPISGNVLPKKCCSCGTMLEAWREVLGLLRSWVAQRRKWCWGHQQAPHAAAFVAFFKVLELGYWCFTCCWTWGGGRGHLSQLSCGFSCLEGSLAKTPWQSRWDPRDGSTTMTRFQPTAKAMESGMGLHSAAIALAVSEGLGDLCSRQGGCDLVWEELFEDLPLFPDR